MNFNFNVSNTSAVRNVRRPLAPWEIYKVKFTGMEIREFQGKKDPTQTFKMLQANFECEEGYHNVSFWYPKDGDTIRRKYERFNGGTGYFPSSFESMWAKLKQTIEVLVPDGLEKLGKLIPKCKSFDDIANVVIKLTDSVKGKETNIKLVGVTKDGKVNAETPNIVAINTKLEVAEDSNNDQGEAFISDNYIGDLLYFSEYEEKKRRAYLTSKATSMPNDDSEEVVIETQKEISKEEDESLDDLLKDL